MNWKTRLEKALGQEIVRFDEDIRLKYAFDESRLPIPYPPDAVVFPRTVDEVSKILQIADEFNIPVVARGGGTSVTGGPLAVNGGILIVFDRMNSVKEISPGDLHAVVEPGIITGEFHKAVESEGLFYPPDPASLDSCTIGGNVAENAGGPRALKYGVTKHYVESLEIVLPGGDIHRVGRPTKKWVAGYDLVSLITGSEGTLGIITEVTLRLIPKPEDIQTLLVAFSDARDASVAVTEIILSGILPRTLEFVDKKALEVVKDQTPSNLPDSTDAILIFEVDGNPAETSVNVEKAAEIFLKFSALEIFMAQTDADRERLWRARRSVLPSLESKYRYVRSEDLVYPRTKIPDAVDLAYKVEGTTGIPICTFGHIGDGNLHVNLLFDEWDDPRVEDALRLLYEGTIALNGTISGEHGIGMLKKKYLPIEQSTELIELQKQFKRVLDPKGLLNPGKIFP